MCVTRDLYLICRYCLRIESTGRLGFSLSSTDYVACPNLIWSHKGCVSKIQWAAYLDSILGIRHIEMTQNVYAS